MNAHATRSFRLSPVPLGLSISGFFAITLLSSIFLGLVVPDGGDKVIIRPCEAVTSGIQIE